LAYASTLEPPGMAGIRSMRKQESPDFSRGESQVVLRVEVQDLKAMTVLGTKIGNLQDVVTTETLIAAEK